MSQNVYGDRLEICLPVAEPQLIDTAVSLKDYEVRITVKDGKIVKIEIAEEALEEAMPLRDKLQTVIYEVTNLSKNTGMASEEELLKVLEEKHKISREESKELIRALLMEGKLYHPKDGFLKRT